MDWPLTTSHFEYVLRRLKYVKLPEGYEPVGKLLRTLPFTQDQSLFILDKLFGVLMEIRQSMIDENYGVDDYLVFANRDENQLMIYLVSDQDLVALRLMDAL